MKTVIKRFEFHDELQTMDMRVFFLFLSKSGMSRDRSSVVGEPTEAEKCRCVVVCVNVRMCVRPRR